MPRPLAHPLTLALLLTLANGVKPVVIDDTAYLTFARHLAQRPLDPYGFELFWYEKPEPAMEIILPPVLPYWLAAGMAFFGEDLLLLKLWLFPFAAVLAFASRSLVRRFVGRDASPALALLVVGPGVLPFFNFMLDIPALALQSAAVALAVRGTDAPRRWPALVLAGVCLGLALQTKYSVLGLPAVLFAAAALRRQWLAGLVVVGLGLALFTAWELFLVHAYGRSHFVYHLTRKGGQARGLLDFVDQKLLLTLPLFAHLGLTAGWVGLVGVGRVVSAQRLRVTAGIFFAVAMVIAWLPGAWTVLDRSKPPAANPLTLADVYFRFVGGLAFLAAGRFAVMAAFRGRGFTPRPGWEGKFLAAWFVLEVGGYFAITPFPAARRTLGVAAVMALLALRLWARLRRVEPRVRAASWVLAVGLLTGLVVAAIDAWDALAEREMPRQAARIAADRRWAGTGYFVGHWGFQHYATEAGLRIVVPGVTRLEPGDWLLLPVNPDGREFFRPHDGEGGIEPDEKYVRLDLILTWDDWLAAQTIPPLYAGRTPVTSLTHPRMTLALYRVTAAWTPPAK